MLRDAKATLSEDGILAIIAMRHERAVLSVLEDFVLRGECDATRNSGIPEDAPLRSRDFAFCGVPEEVQAERRMPQPHLALLSRLFFAPLSLLAHVSRLLG